MSAKWLGAAALALAMGCSSFAPSEEETQAPLPNHAAGVQPGGSTDGATAPGERGGIPVLVFHQICNPTCTEKDTYGISQSELRRMLGSMKRSGYETISMADFVRAHAGDAIGLPARPLLLTFDDGRVDGYANSDPVLDELHYQATMFVITAAAADPKHFSMQWSEMRAAAASGRWTVQLHAHAGHVEVPTAVDATGKPTLGAFYANRQCAPGGPGCAALEPFEDWRQRAEIDLAVGTALLDAHLGPEHIASQSFAVPYSEYGQRGTNDPRIAPTLRAYLNAHFAVWFTQPSADPSFMKPSAVHEVGRFSVHRDTTTEDVEAWLAKHALP